MLNHRRLPGFALVLLASCGQAPQDGALISAAPASVSVASHATATIATSATTAPFADAPFGDGEHAFSAIKSALLARYGGNALTEDELYRAATQGMLEHVDATHSAWNKLLSPGELRALHEDLHGEVVGIGTEVSFEVATGYADIVNVLSGSPAETAGVLAGDKILDVDGKLFKGKTQKDVLAQIRGKAGETVTLGLLREDRVLTIPVVRQVVSYEVVEQGMLPDRIGYLRIKSFNAKTRPSVDRGLSVLAKAGARAMVVDLRGNQGGGFDDALATADALLPRGAAIVTLTKKGESTQTLTAPVGASTLGSVPMVVLVNGDTASGGELLTAALQTDRKAEVVGQKTFGKWTLQPIEDLPNGYAAKYTVSVFHAPNGETYDGVGLVPDLEVDLDHASYVAAERAKDVTQRLAVDRQLRTAANLLRGK